MNMSNEINVIGPHDKTVRDQKKFLKPSMTQQQFLEESKTTNIIARYRRTGQIPMRNGAPFYGDFTGADDFHSAQNRLAEANQMFMLIPAEIRDRFDNDPGKLIEFLSKEENRKEAEEIGLIPPKKKPAASEKGIAPSDQKEGAGGNSPAEGAGVKPLPAGGKKRTTTIVEEV